jgi:hypothetical protein
LSEEDIAKANAELILSKTTSAWFCTTHLHRVEIRAVVRHDVRNSLERASTSGTASPY